MEIAFNTLSTFSLFTPPQCLDSHHALSKLWVLNMLIPPTEIPFYFSLAPLFPPLLLAFISLFQHVFQFLGQILLSLENFPVPKIELYGFSICFHSTLYLISPKTLLYFFTILCYNRLHTWFYSM